ncbi:NACHT, LRR and PYD domains-containing protein 14 [Heterocephalus glaber]|uniref:NACHT, LRR and PYD domains-containing protein 14 n=1 Tax=Heterocephalus glaber TaxID=10181 RepID=G5B7C3_HETGA|nr:NACHT, LRR and PYD domains-containing protein 14 [Heterocephalus glaber]
MVDSPTFSSFTDFGLLLYLEELNNEELNKFKLLLKETIEPEHCLMPWTAVKMADRQQLANLINKYYPEEQAQKMTLELFAKLNLREMCERARAKINWTPETMEQEMAEEAELSAGTKYKIQIKEKFHILEKNSLLREASDFHHGLSEEHQKLLVHLFDVEITTGQQIRTVVLQGAAGVGKTALMRKAMLAWAEGNLYRHKFTYVFYLNGKEISQVKEKSFAQLISKDWPSTEIPIEKILSQPSNLLFIIDSFDELNFAFEEPEFALCGDWTQVHPVSFLISSLLRKVMLPESSLLVTVRRTASNRLKRLLTQRLLRSRLYVDLQGMSTDARKEYIYQFFEDRTWAMNAFNSIRSNEMLFNMCRVPLVCRFICACLKQQMEKNDDVTKTCQTATAVFTCYISSLFAPVGEHFPNLPNEAQLRNLCYLAAKGVWTMTHVLYRNDLRKHGFTTCDTSTFLDINILQKDTEYENCYVFTHLHIQEFLGAMFYLLKRDLKHKEHSSQSLEDLKLLLESRSDQDPHLTQLKYFLFGLLNADIVKQLEETFKCRLSLKIKWEVLQWVKVLGNRDTFPPWLVFMDLFHYLYETQDEAFVAQAMGKFSKVVINMSKEIDLPVSSFCLKHCRCLQTLKLAINMVNSSAAAENGLRCVSFPHGYQDIFSFLTCQQNLMYLDLKGNKIEDNGIKSLCEALQYPECKLQNLRLESCNLTPICCADISKALIKSQNLVFLSLSTNNLLDEGVKLLCEALGHPECYLERLSLESCGLTEASCEALSLALISNKRLTHLCLSNNKVGDHGIKLLSAALKHPECTLQSLVLIGSVLTTACCPDLASAILNSPNLLSLDLGYNDLRDEGVKILCEALRNPKCNIQRLGLEHCGLTSLCCQDLSSALLSNKRLVKMNLTQNTLGREGIRTLCEVLRCTECKLQVLGLWKDTFDKEAQRLLEAVRVSNPNLAIDDSYNNKEWWSWWWYL